VLLGFLTQLGRVRANEIRMFAGDGMLLYTSPPPVYKAGRSAPQWFTHLVTPRTQQVELNVKGGRIVITPDPSRSILDAWDDMRNLIWLALLFLVLVNGVVFWLLGRALQPVARFCAGSRRWSGASSTRGCRTSLCRNSMLSARPSTGWPAHWKKAMPKTRGLHWSPSSPRTRS
jgi:hypothetical protein